MALRFFVYPIVFLGLVVTRNQKTNDMKKTMNVWKWFPRTGLLVLCWLALPMLASGLQAQVCDTLRLTLQVVEDAMERSLGFSSERGKNFAVDWGDGVVIQVTSDDRNMLNIVYHEYTDTGRYAVLLYALTSDAYITYLDIRNGGLTSLDASGCMSLMYLDCRWNKLTSLNLNGCTSLLRLYCSNNELTSLDVSGCAELITLSCNQNKLMSLNVNGCIAMEQLDCSNNQLIMLNVSGCPFLSYESSYLNCSNNQLASLDVSDCMFSTFSRWEPSYLDCSNNHLTSLNVSGCEFLANGAVSYLDCSNNQLTSLDVSKNVNLNELDCSFNQLTSLDLSQNTQLYSLDFSNNIRAVDLTEDNGFEMSLLSGIVVDKIYDLNGGYIENERLVFENDTVEYWYDCEFVNGMNDGYGNTRFKLCASAPLTPVVATPEFSIPDGKVNIGVVIAVDSGTVITLNCATEGASIYYTINGSVPTTESILYKDGITMDQPIMVIRAIAIKDKCISSEIVKATFRFKRPTANESALSVAPFAYVQGRTAYISDGLGEVEAFTAAGQRVYRGSDRSVTLPRPGVYVLRVVADGRRCKMVVR